MQHFEDFMEAYAQATDDDARRDVEARLWDAHGVEAAVYIMDMAGFTRLSKAHGIVHYLSMIQRSRATVPAIVQDHGGTVVKFEADNGYYRFPGVAQAIDAALELNHAFAEQNRNLEEHHHIHTSAGIAYGRVLLVGDHDYYGNPVNVASKLGEDLASGGEALVADDAMATLPAGKAYDSETFTEQISGVELHVHRILF